MGLPLLPSAASRLPSSPHEEVSLVKVGIPRCSPRSWRGWLHAGGPATAGGGSAAEETPREYSVRGVVRRVEPERRSVVVKHEEIPGFMPAMTMPFDVKEPKELNGLKPGDRIAFRMLVTTNDGWIDGIHIVGSDTNAVATPRRCALPLPCLCWRRDRCCRTTRSPMSWGG